MTAETIKACCADLYASDWARLLLGDSLHPGGLALTKRLGVLLGLGASSRVLDVAAGRGTSALHLARVFDCQVTGLDYSGINVARAREAAEREGLSDRVAFLQGDAEELSALADESFDVVVCECAYCTFPNKRAAAAQIARVLVPGGRFGLSDLTCTGELAPDLNGLLAWIACIADAQPVAGYLADLEAVGLRVTRVEAHDHVLSELIDHARGRLLVAELATRMQEVNLPSGVDLQLARRMARSAADAVKCGTLGYALIIASRTVNATPARAL
jgi:arsenite methyltransferase